MSPTSENLAPAVPSILAVSTSLKTAHSASRALLQLAVDRLAPVYPSVELLDLGEHHVPSFAGEDPNKSKTAAPLLEKVSSCGGLLLSVPCYWSSVSGVFKNLIDVLSGPAYDLAEPTTVFANKPVALIVVGADATSASHGCSDASRILEAVGARLVGDPIIVTEPRTVPIPSSVPDDIARLSAMLARTVLGSYRGGRDDS